MLKASLSAGTIRYTHGGTISTLALRAFDAATGERRPNLRQGTATGDLGCPRIGTGHSVMSILTRLSAGNLRGLLGRGDHGHKKDEQSCHLIFKALVYVFLLHMGYSQKRAFTYNE